MPPRRKLADAIRALAMDAVQKAKSGHPGMPMGMADIAEVLWNDFLRHNPNNPKWSNRDRFILSNGHGCMLQYALLHLSGHDVTMDDIKAFRQLHSRTPGHPEFGYTPGVEATTGPLGQGIANGVGMALAERLLAHEFNREGYPIVDHHTYVFLGDGCLMEGISHEACSFAGTLKLNKLIAFYDDNGISIDGEVVTWFSEDVQKRFEAYGWQVLAIDGHDGQAVEKAIQLALQSQDKPVLIQCKTTIGFGAPTKAGSADCHGAPLGDEEIQKTRDALGWTYPPFEIPEDIYAAWDARVKGAALESAWQAMFDAYQHEHPALAEEFVRREQKKSPTNWPALKKTYLEEAATKQGTLSTRLASQKCLTQLVAWWPEMVGGSADLTHSNLTIWPKAEVIVPDTLKGRYLHYGVREFGMSAIMNGMALHGSIIPFGGTFLMFMEYARNAVRLCAMMRQRVIFVYTHDSIGLGEDGPTHQAVEQLASLRLVPHLSVWRPADWLETAVAWAYALERVDGPTALILSRQNIPASLRAVTDIEDIERGGYILLSAKGHPDVVILATGSEVPLALTVAKRLATEGIAVQVSSMPALDVFAAQPNDYREKVLAKKARLRVAIEAGVSHCWYQWVGEEGLVIGIDEFGASAPAKDVFEAYGFGEEAIYQRIQQRLGSL